MDNTQDPQKEKKSFPGIMKNLRKLKDKIRDEFKEPRPEGQKSSIKRKAKPESPMCATPPADSNLNEKDEDKKNDKEPPSNRARKKKNNAKGKSSLKRRNKQLSSVSGTPQVDSNRNNEDGEKKKEEDKKDESCPPSSRSRKRKKDKKKAETPREIPETVTDKFNFVPTLLQKELSGIRKEFADFKTEDKMRAPVATVCQEPENSPKNRYKNILCLDSSRVKLSDGGYYHANAVDSRFILAQSPLPNTVEHFWDLIQTEGVEAIVQLHPCDEGRKCAKYYPVKVGENCEFGVYKVSNCRADPPNPEEPNLQLSQLAVQGPKGEQKIKHVFWSSFPPIGFPEPSNTIPFIWKQIKQLKKVLVHCSSGAGRSAVVVLTCQMLERIQQAVEVDALKMLKDIREKRHNAIRNEMQYVYVMRIILFYFMKYNAVEMSQNLLIFIDDFDAYAKKFEREEKERKEKAPNPQATEPTDEFQNLI